MAGGRVMGPDPPHQQLYPPPPPPPLPTQLDLLNTSPLLNIPIPHTLPPPTLLNDPSPPTIHLNQTVSSIYYDIDSFTSSFKSSKHSVITSLNVQSLQSKFNAIQHFFNETEKNNTPVAILALQETWSIPHPELLKIRNYSFIHAQRKGQRGGWRRFLHP